MTEKIFLITLHYNESGHLNIFPPKTVLMGKCSAIDAVLLISNIKYLSDISKELNKPNNFNE